MFFFVLIFVGKIGIRDGLRNQTITNFGSKQKKSCQIKTVKNETTEKLKFAKMKWQII